MKLMKRQNTLMDIWNKSSVKKSTYGSVIYDDKKCFESKKNVVKECVDLTPISVNGMPTHFNIIDIPKDGNCLFTVLCRQLNSYGVEKDNKRTVVDVRTEIFDFMHRTQFV